MSWFGFRPSDDASMCHYLVPSNMLAVLVLEYLDAMPIADAKLKTDALALTKTIRDGIESYGKITHPTFG
jgi:uncharacterized protein